MKHVDELLAEASRYRERRIAVAATAWLRYNCTNDRAMQIARRYMAIFGDKED